MIPDEKAGYATLQLVLMLQLIMVACLHATGYERWSEAAVV